MAILRCGTMGDALTGDRIALPIPWAREAMLTTGASTSFSTSYATTKAQLTADECPPEPPTKTDGLGRTVYVDAVAGRAYTDCIQAKLEAAERATYDRIVAKGAGAPGGCGPEPPFIVHANGVKEYLQGATEAYGGNALGAAWAACMGYTTAAAPAAAAPAAAAPAAADPAASSPTSAAPAYIPAEGLAPASAEAAYVPAGAVVPGFVPEKDPAPAALVQAAPPVVGVSPPSSSSSSTGLYVGIGAAALAVGVGLYLALR